MMIRRLVQNPARRPRRGEVPLKQNFLDSYTSICSRSIVGDAGGISISPQVDGDTSSSSTSSSMGRRPISHIINSSHAFEIQCSSIRRLSSEAIQAISLCRDHDFFGNRCSSIHTSGDDVMLNPFLSSIHQDGHAKSNELAFLELFKAISTLNRQPATSAADLSIDLANVNVGRETAFIYDEDRLGVKDEDPLHVNTETKRVDIIEDKPDINGISTIVPDAEEHKEERKSSQDSVTASNSDREKHKISCELGMAINHPDRASGCQRLIELFDEAQSSPDLLFGSKQINRIFNYLLRGEVSADYNVWEHQAVVKLLDMVRSSQQNLLGKGKIDRIFDYLLNDPDRERGQETVVTFFDNAQSNLHGLLGKEQISKIFDNLLQDDYSSALYDASHHQWVMKLFDEVLLSPNELLGNKQIATIFNYLLNDPDRARGQQTLMKLFDEARIHPHGLLGNKQIVGTFYDLLLKDGDVAAAYDVLKYHFLHCEEQGRSVDLVMYQRLFQKIRSVELHAKHNSNIDNFKASDKRMTLDQLQNLITDITEHIRKEYSDGKKMVYQYILLPEFVMYLVSHKNHHIKRSAKPIMEYILDAQFPLLNPDLYTNLLTMLTPGITGQNYLPHHRILSHLMSNGHLPRPEHAINVLHCYSPYSDNLQATHRVLSIIQQLHPEDGSPPSEATDYRVDLGTLESISMASAGRNVDLNLLVWDMAEQFGYKPTEAMFEDVIMSFAAAGFQDENIYSALVDMENVGFAPSQGVLKYVSTHLSKHPKRLNHSSKMLVWHENEHMRSTSTMNALMMGYGLGRDINSAFRVYEDLEKFHLKPDANTFSFLMEVLYIDTHERFPYNASEPQLCSTDDINDVIGASHILLDDMEEAGIAKTKHFFHNHIRLLCSLGLLDDAKLILEEAIRSRTPLAVGSLMVIGSRFAERGEFDKAYAVAELSVAAGCGELPNLVGRINNIKNPNRRKDRR